MRKKAKANKRKENCYCIYSVLANSSWAWGLPCGMAGTRCALWAALSITKSFLSTCLGLCFSKPSVIFLLEQGKEPWMVKTELTDTLSTGEWGVGSRKAETFEGDSSTWLRKVSLGSFLWHVPKCLRPKRNLGLSQIVSPLANLALSSLLLPLFLMTYSICFPTSVASHFHNSRQGFK